MKKNNIIIGILIGIILIMAGFIVYDKVIRKEDTKNIVKVTKFESNYSLTEEEKEEIAEIIPTYWGYENIKVDPKSITINTVHDYLLEISFKETNYNASLEAWIFKTNDKFKCSYVGSGYLGYPDGTTTLTRELDKLKNIFE